VQPTHLYIHAPFCARRCSYCDFAVTVARRPPADEWREIIAAELAGVVAEEGWSAPLELDTVYIGGGTPSLLGADAMGELAAALAPAARWDAATVEWTVEANPESFDETVARAWCAAGVNRLSLGVQTFHAPALKWMGRLHGPEGPARAVAAARSAGIGNISIDLIFGLPAQLGRSWEADLDRALALEPEHISLYGLTAEPGAALGRWVREGRVQLPGEDDYAREYLLAAERLSSAGFRHYEVSNFALPGHEARHNSAYWTRAPYLGLGPGAHSFLPPVRRWNLRAWAAYRDAVRAGAPAVAESEVVDDEAARLESVWLGLRTDRGLPLEGATRRRLAAAWVEAGWAWPHADALRLTPAGWLLLDRLAVELAAAELDSAPRCGQSSARTGSNGQLRCAHGHAD